MANIANAYLYVIISVKDTKMALQEEKIKIRKEQNLNYEEFCSNKKNDIDCETFKNAIQENKRLKIKDMPSSATQYKSPKEKVSIVEDDKGFIIGSKKRIEKESFKNLDIPEIICQKIG